MGAKRQMTPTHCEPYNCGADAKASAPLFYAHTGGERYPEYESDLRFNQEGIQEWDHNVRERTRNREDEWGSGLLAKHF